jgi:hypothetical protein
MHARNIYRYYDFENEPQGVGGLTVPINKFSLFTPYLALVATTILAISVSVAYFKRRKKQ